MGSDDFSGLRFDCAAAAADAYKRRKSPSFLRTDSRIIIIILVSPSAPTLSQGSRGAYLNPDGNGEEEEEEAEIRAGPGIKKKKKRRKERRDLWKYEREKRRKGRNRHQAEFWGTSPSPTLFCHINVHGMCTPVDAHVLALYRRSGNADNPRNRSPSSFSSPTFPTLRGETS